MPRHVVRQGECAASVAARYGLSATALLDRDANHGLRDARANPHVLAPGDVLDVPEPAVRQLAFSPGGTKRYTASVPRTNLRLKLTTPTGEAAANKRFQVELPGAKSPIEGTTDGDGVLDVPIGVNYTSATILLFLGEEDPIRLPVRIGHLDPEHLDSGVAGRLRNLGYSVGEGSEALAQGVRAFQRRESLPESGVVDEDTRARLVERHGV